MLVASSTSETISLSWSEPVEINAMEISNYSVVCLGEETEVNSR